jgi:hypothetical protein
MNTSLFEEEISAIFEKSKQNKEIFCRPAGPPGEDFSKFFKSQMSSPFLINDENIVESVLYDKLFFKRVFQKMFDLYGIQLRYEINEENVNSFFDAQEKAYVFQFSCIFKNDGTYSTVYINKKKERKCTKITCFHESCQTEEKYKQIENYLDTLLAKSFVEQANNEFVKTELTVRELIPKMIQESFEKNGDDIHY